jgi:hypothetical protein
MLNWNLKDMFERAECKNIRKRERRKSCKSKEVSDYTAKTDYRKLSTNIPEEKELRVCERFIYSHDGLPILLQENMWTDSRNI